MRRIFVAVVAAHLVAVSLLVGVLNVTGSVARTNELVAASTADAERAAFDLCLTRAGTGPVAHCLPK